MDGGFHLPETSSSAQRVNKKMENSEGKDHVVIFDTTLRDAEQTPGAKLAVREKIEIAHQLSRLNVDVIEAGFPISSEEDFEAVRRIGQEVVGPVIC